MYYTWHTLCDITAEVLDYGTTSIRLSIQFGLLSFDNTADGDTFNGSPRGQQDLGGETGDYIMEVERRTRCGAGGVFEVLSLMQKRSSTMLLDKVAGLTYLLMPKFLRKYDAEQPEECAWAALVNMRKVRHRALLLFLYPEPGDGSKLWRPSWEQAMTKTLPTSRLFLGPLKVVLRSPLCVVRLVGERSGRSGSNQDLYTFIVNKDQG
ncbi:hypothetical protein ARMSODRAFT_1034365 [Armillaria solidipes]|uniref:Uncharacterized protein n=1 Tax=Armillaria solidipes TaxID=1076256 RepID=A0A2H3AIL2_9AGAR|nr:hypothetical protein ARMSODRAFT_1034365 [Armillaria solidipes]